MAHNLTTWAIGFSNQIISRRILQYRTACEKADPFCGSKSKNPKLGIGSHKKQAIRDEKVFFHRGKTDQIDQIDHLDPNLPL